MIINSLPYWLPPFNLVVSIAALIGALVIMRKTSNNYALVVSTIVLVAGAAFQSNLMDLFMWTITGTGGRLLVLGLIVWKLTLIQHNRNSRL